MADDPTRSDPRRRLGATGEQLAAQHLEARGCEVIARNFRTRFGELDLVARDARFLIFCEVKTRVVRGVPVPGGAAAGPANPLGPFASIGSRKQRQVRAIAREWLAHGLLEGPRPPEIRFDAIGISFDASGRLLSLEHLEAAF
ncbi:MAG TPA: YraN family protein [Thermoleophilaceae bacterium]